MVIENNRPQSKKTTFVGLGALKKIIACGYHFINFISIKSSLLRQNLTNQSDHGQSEEQTSSIATVFRPGYE